MHGSGIHNRRREESGQVLMTGVIMALILLLAILLLFDVHSVMRAKYKTETANQAAALAGAEWQKQSLNLIGEINLVKACETMMESNDHWPATAGSTSLKERIGLLSEMQARVTFLGPLVGFAAAQQAAKRNGMSPVQSSDGTLPLQSYITRLNNDARYRNVETVQNFKWRAPYTRMISDIVSNGVVAYPNARSAGNPVVTPSGLAKDALYNAIWNHETEIKAGDPPDQSAWLGVIYPFIKKKTDADYEGRWWDINYDMSQFPAESEIFTLGVEYGTTDYDDNAYTILQNLLGNGNSAYQVGELPEVNFCIYDNFWYPAYYRKTYSDYDEDHYHWWFEAGVLRKTVKPQYCYEGPAAYAETAADINLVGRYAMRGGSRTTLDKRFIRRTDPENNSYSRRVGSTRTDAAGSSDLDTDYRPGAIAKVLGTLEADSPPIAIPIILPVFNDTSLMPTYMPVPYGFGVLRPTNSTLERFLNWLSRQNSLFTYTEDPPAGTGGYLEALQLLSKGAAFRYYGWNPSWDSKAFDTKYSVNASVLFTERGYVYSQANANGAGWLQEAQVFTVTNSADIGVTDVTDYVNGGTAQRFFKSETSREYIVVDTTGHIITNDESDPTIHRTTSGGSGSGSGSGGIVTGTDSQKGPQRI